MEKQRTTPKIEIVRRLETNVPAQLRESPQWVLWKYEGLPGEKLKKPPFTADGRLASVTSPETWTTFPRALAAYTQRSEYEGIGLMLTKGLTVIDLDNCLDTTGQLTPAAKYIVQTAQSYTEISPSGKGLHIFLRGNIPGTARRRGSVEMYDSSRYITVTGHQLQNTPAEIRKDQEIINQIHTRFISPPEATRSPRTAIYQPQLLSDHQVIEKALRAKNGEKFQQLWSGDHPHQSPSEAHIATIAMLAYWTNGDANQMDRLFRQSGQFDEGTARKWDERHRADGKTYGQITIEKALATKRIY